jgi:hypothetical protein
MRVARAIGKDEREVARQLMEQLKTRGHPDAPPAIATDVQGSDREAMAELYEEICRAGAITEDMVERYAPEVLDRVFPG